MDRLEKCGKKFAELFGGKPVKDEGTDPEFMRILQRFIFGEVSYTGSLDNRMRELVTVTVLFCRLPEDAQRHRCDERSLFRAGHNSPSPRSGDGDGRGSL